VSETSDKTAIIWDSSGDYTHIAEAIAPDFARVLYYSYWQTGFPDPKHFLPGIGLDGVERIDDFFDYVKEADIAIFPDVGNWGLQEFLRSQGLPVFGSGVGGKLEQDRILLKQTCERVGIDVPKWFIVRGIDALTDALSKLDRAFVKLSYFRGARESFEHKNWCATERALAELRLSLGPYEALTDFVIEIPIDDEDGPCGEFGFDTFCADGVFPSIMMWGPEVKDACFLGTTASLPPRLQDIADRLAPTLREDGYRGPISIEARCTNEGTFVIDFTARFGSPPSEVQSKYITNLADVIWAVAHGEMLQPDYRAKYSGQFVITSDAFQENALAIEVEDLSRVALHGHCRFKKGKETQDYVVSPSEIAELGGACGWGDSMEDTAAAMIAAADGVKGYHVHYDLGSLQQGLEVIKTGEQLDMNWSGDNG
jgi:hypothetical protein